MKAGSSLGGGEGLLFSMINDLQIKESSLLAGPALTDIGQGSDRRVSVGVKGEDGGCVRPQ